MSLAAIDLNIPYIVSLQGVVSEIYKHVLTGMEPDAIFNKSIRDIIFGGSTIDLRHLYKKLSIFEKKIVFNSKGVVGRTEWDKAWVNFNFSNIYYYKHYEPLRKEFLNSRKWDFNLCEKKQIFLSQSNTSIKGLHILLDAIQLLKQNFPNINLIIAGKNYKTKTFRNFILRTSYEKYILKKIKTFGLEQNVKFIGPQNVNKMIDNLLKSNLFVQPSLIENSPNSLMEAVFLNVPSVAAYVGGIPSLYEDFENVSLYQSDSALMLANKISLILQKTTFRENPLLQNNDNNGNALINIYIHVLAKEN